MIYSIKEIFYTVQGEGVHTGRASVFCRFSGCNLWNGREENRKTAKCSFCDTDFVGTNGEGGGKFIDANKLAQTIISFWPSDERPFVVLTGGEPMLQVDNCLINTLKKYDCEIAIETNGTIKVPREIDWICVSPKAGNKIIQTSGDELKLVYPQTGVKPRSFEKYAFKNFSLQPMDGALKVHNTNLTLDYCMKNPRWRLSLQTHKVIGIR